MKVQVVHIDACPNWEAAGDRLCSALHAAGLAEVSVEYVLLTTPEQAADVEFAGSPTILLDGTDAFPSVGRATDLACRVYVTPNGLAGLPTQEQLEQAIRARL